MMPIAIPVLLHLGASHCPRSCNAFTCDRRWCRACCACGGTCTLPAPEPPRPPVDQEHALLEILLKSLTAMHAQHAPGLKKRSGVALGEFGLRNRAWEGGGHIGNSPAQASAYYDLVRAERERLAPAPLRLCEVGLNGGHSAVILLAAGGHAASLTMFDLMKYSYSQRAVDFVNALFPGAMALVRGNSHRTLRAFGRSAAGRGACDVFSIDGDHRYAGALADIADATHATRAGGVIVLDDMAAGGPTRRALERAVRSGALAAPRCTEGVRIHVSTRDRLDRTEGLLINASWCRARVLAPLNRSSLASADALGSPRRRRHSPPTRRAA